MSILQRNGRRFLFAASLILGCLTSYGQGVTTASMSGEVTDESGQGLAGATVVAVHNPTGTQYGVSTRSDGRYNLPNLRIGGPYTLTISFVGYETKNAEEIYLKLGENLKLDFQTKPAATELGEVVITGGSELMNKDKTGASMAFDNNTIRKLPTITRSAADIYRLTPSSDGNSFAGRNDQFNNFSLNGSIFNNPFGLDAPTPGGQTDAQPISLDAIDQIQVSIAPFDVTQAGFTGAAVNAVTKSGTNNFEGTVFGFFRSDALTGKKVKGEEIFVPELKQQQIGFSVGGPIIKDKLFFFANFEMERRDDLGSSFVSDNGQSGLNVSRVLKSDLDAVGDALRAIGYDPGPYEGYIHETNNQKGIIKFDWNISKNHTFTAIYNFLDASKQKPAHPSAIGRRGPDATTLQFRNSGYQINNKLNSFLGELKSVFGNKYSNKFQIGYSHFDDFRDPMSTPFPVLNINRDNIRYIVAGHEPFSINNTLDQKVFQFSNNFDIYLGQHNFTVGLSLEKFDFDNSFNLGVYEPFERSFAGGPYNGNADYYAGGTFGNAEQGLFGFNSVAEFLNYANSGQMENLATYSQDVFDNNTWALAETNVGQFAFYLQDKWNVNNDLTVTLGLRADIPLYFDTKTKIQENIDRSCCYEPTVTYFDEKGNPVNFNQTDLPDQKPLISPRLGFNWDVKGERKTILRGGTGLFTGRFPFVWIGNQVANPNYFFYNMTKKDFKFPQVWRTNIGIDRAFGEGWIATADFMYTEDINSMIVRNYGIKPPSGQLTGPDNRQIYTAGDRTTEPVFDPGQNAYVFTNSDLGRVINMTFELKRNWSNGLYTSLAYNFLDAQDVSSLEGEITSDSFDRNPARGNVNIPVLAPSLFGNQHRVVGSANKTISYGEGKFATTFSLFFEYAKGGRFSYTYSGDINRDGSGFNDLIYIPTASELSSLTFSGTAGEQTTQRSAMEAFIQQDDYLSENRGSYMEKYGMLSPMYSRWDLRILQDFKIGKDNTLQLSMDVLNLGNLISSEWGVRQFPTNTQPIGVSVDGGGNPTYSFDPTLTDTFTYDAGLLSRWQIQFGVRYIFK